MIYFDNAATSFPKPPQVARAVGWAVERLGGNPGRGGHALAMRAAEEVYRVRKSAAALFAAPGPENVVFTQNCTHALNLLLFGLLEPGDHVVISDLEHNSVWRPLCYLQSRGVVHLTVAETCPEDPAATLAAFDRAITPGTRLVLCTHSSNVTGWVLPVEQIARLAHRRGALAAVDGAQSAGVLPLGVDGSIDYLCLAGHKGLYGPAGTGLLVAGDGPLLRPLLRGGTGSLSASWEMPDFYPDRLECGTQNLCGIVGLGQGLDFVQSRSIDRLYAHEFGLLATAYNYLSKCNGVKLYTGEPRFGAAAPVLSFNLRNKSGEETAQLLSAHGFALRGGLHCAPLAHKKLGTLERGTARLSFGAFNHVNEVYRFCETVKKLAG